MRTLASLVFSSGVVLAAIACSSSTDSAAPGDPDAAASSTSSGSTDTDANASSSSGNASSSGASADSAPDAAVVWVKQTTETMDHLGAARKYILSVPLDYDANKSYPLYMWLHGNPSSAAWAAQYSPVEPFTKNEAIAVYPEALTEGNWDHGVVWSDNADGTFLIALIDELAGKYNIDKSRVLLSGWSGGGFMSSAMACRFHSSFKAIGVHSGGAPYDPGGGDNPDCPGAQIPTLVTHGGMDNAVGGDSGYYAAEYWRKHNGCDGTRTASAPALCETYDNCDAGKPVKYCYDPNGTHALFANANTIEWDWFKSLP